MRRGLVIGKFYPPHLGHKSLIDTALANSQNVDVLVCVRPDQTIEGSLRVQWLKEMCPSAHVFEIEDICDDDNSARWAEYVKQVLGRAPDVVFTSEEYGERFAAFLGCEHVSVDRTRTSVPISSTLLRSRPLANWNFMTPLVRAHFAKRICVVGAESTGTTTIAQALAETFETIWVPEYGREYALEKLANIHPSATPVYDWTSEEFTHIAVEQAKREDEMIRDANRVLICDTDGLATSVWHERYMGFRLEKVEQFARSRKYDLYFLTDCDIPFEQDGTRDGESVRECMTERLTERLEQFGRRWIKLSGTHEERMRVAVAAVSSVLKE
jgi:HTH-type transcriptional regulator, transcriptional repressor of NAD biosynthesis genes